MTRGRALRLVASGFVEGLIADRDGSVRDVVGGAAGAHATLRTKRLDLAAGLGRVVWGRLDELQPTDVVNPLDLSRFFFEGRSEARLAVPLVRATLYAGEKASIEGVYVPFFRRGRFDRLAEAFVAVHPRARDPVLGPIAGAHRRQRTGRRAASFTTGRVDWSVSGYRGFRPFGIYAATGPLTVDRVYPRFTMAASRFRDSRRRVGRSRRARRIRPRRLPASGRRARC